MGLATAKLLLDKGARVLVTGRSEAAVQSASDALGPNAIAIQSDATSMLDIDGALPPCSGHGICGYAASGSVAVVRVFS
ncbi:hypothetical protein [Mycobacterium intracellulare]